MNYEKVASELIRALRGKRSQTALCRRLGYRSNVVYIWESGAGFPSAARALELAARVGVNPAAAVVEFYGRRPEWLDQHPVTSPAGVAAFLRDLRGRQSLTSLATAVGRDRYALARWFKGQTEPRLPDFLRVVECTSLRLLDFLGALVDLDQLPAVANAGQRLAAARRMAHEAPWSHAVLRALELESYARLPRHEPGWIAGRVGISEEQEAQCLEALELAGQIVWCDERWRPQSAPTLDLRHDPRATQELAVWCAQQGSERLAQQGPGAFAFNVFAVSDKDYERLRQLQRDYFGQLRSIIAESTPSQRLIVANLHLFELGSGAEGSPSTSRSADEPERQK